MAVSKTKKTRQDGSREICRMKLADLAPAPYNPRRISPEALAGLQASVRRFGCVEFPVWNKRTNRLVGDHKRVEAMQAEGITETDVVVIDLSPAEEKALNVALNNPAIQGEFTEDLESLLAEIQSDTPDLYADLLLAELAEEAGIIPGEKGENDPNAEWQGMPEMDAEPRAERSLIIHFPTHGDVASFAAAIQRDVGDKTKYIWWPQEPKAVESVFTSQ